MQVGVPAPLMRPEYRKNFKKIITLSLVGEYKEQVEKKGSRKAEEKEESLMEDKKIQEMEVEKMAMDEMDKVAGGAMRDGEYVKPNNGKWRDRASAKADGIINLNDTEACVR